MKIDKQHGLHEARGGPGIGDQEGHTIEYSGIEKPQRGQNTILITGLQPIIPYPNIAVIAPTNNLIISKRQTCDGSSMANKRRLTPSSFALPNLDSAIVTAGDDSETIPIHRPHALDVAKERLEWPARLHIPHLDSIVERAGEQDRHGG